MGVDRMDQNLSAYRIHIRNKKWYWPLLTWLIDVSIQNAWLNMRGTGKSIRHLEFRRAIVQGYPGRSQSMFRSSLLPDTRFDGLHHYIKKIEKKRRCVGLNCTGKSSAVRFECMKCNVGLCIECFVAFHTR